MRVKVSDIQVCGSIHERDDFCFILADFNTDIRGQLNEIVSRHSRQAAVWVVKNYYPGKRIEQEIPILFSTIYIVVFPIYIVKISIHLVSSLLVKSSLLGAMFSAGTHWEMDKGDSYPLVDSLLWTLELKCIRSSLICHSVEHCSWQG